MELSYFKQSDFLDSLKKLFQTLDIPINYLSDDPIEASEILSDTYKDNDSFKLINKVYFLGIVDDAAFDGYESLNPEKIKSDYDGLLLFGVTLHKRKNDLLPTRSQLAEISRAFNRQFFYTPVVVVFNYQDDTSHYLAFANTERLKYKQEWREGEKAGKVTLLRDIDINKTHAGHLRILKELRIPTTGQNKVDSFASLYQYWQNIFSVSLLNKKFYEELSNWYFWAIDQVTFPSEPTTKSVFAESNVHVTKNKLDVLIEEHRAKNIIRLLTRFLFTWFIKEKKLIPVELFDAEYIKNNLLKDISPYYKNNLITSPNLDSHYYKAILQNLFFASLNCPKEEKKDDKRKRGFSKDHFGVFYLMRYKKYFKDHTLFLTLVNNQVPFLNGGLFECLDIRGEKEEKKDRVYIDGFSDNLPKEHKLIVPDYLFFGAAHTIDLSDEYGSKAKKYKQAAVKGLIKIFESYKFTIAENTPIEEDVALDPELLGKVFENLLASYNPETKTTARKQTGSFYTPREIVNYMVDESLIAHLKTNIKDWQASEADKDQQLHQLLSFDAINPFAEDSRLQKKIINALDHCKILDPACGSGAFPMGILQKMVHILQKVDHDNSHWKQLQLKKAQDESATAFSQVSDKKEREQILAQINDAFDEKVNDPDYARKLFLIENSIYGVDIQPIAVQISKLRFFISLVVEQKVDKNKDNFGIRPLPNLETKFVAANTLIGIEKPIQKDESFAFENQQLQKLEQELKTIRHRLFSAKTPDTKRKRRAEDKAIRRQMGDLLIKDGWGDKTAQQLADWDPYNQNTSSEFFDLEWMFGIKDGVDIVIGNPPYKIIGADQLEEQRIYKASYEMASYKINTYVLFLEKGLSLLRNTDATISYIIPKSLVFNTYMKDAREILLSKYLIPKIIEISERVFENAEVGDNIIFFAQSTGVPKNNELLYLVVKSIDPFTLVDSYSNTQQQLIDQYDSNFYSKEIISNASTQPLKDISCISNGLNPGNVRHILLSQTKESGKCKKMLLGRDVQRYSLNWSGTWVNYDFSLKERLTSSDVKSKKGMTAQKKVDFSLRKEKIFKPHKIVVRKTSDHIIAAYDSKGFYFDSLSYGIHLNETTDISIYYLLGLLNSQYLNYIHESISLNKGKTFAKVLLKNLAQLPIFRVNFSDTHETQLHDNIVFLVRLIHEFDLKEINILKMVIDGLVFQLYFPDHMQKKQIDIADLVKADLNEVLQNRAFESLSTTEKEAVIEQLHRKWTHPDNEVRNRIKLFAVRSPDILKPILESQP